MKHQKFLKAIISMLAFFLLQETHSQTPRLGTWNIINARYNFTKKWNGFFESQTRSQKFFYDHSYYEVKGAFGYRIAKKVNLLLGTGHYATFQNSGNFKAPRRSKEIRVWQQLELNQQIGSVKLEHRFRVEQRFFTTEYRNRFRYRISADIPVGKSKWYFTGFEEIFLTNKKPYFERNRAFAGVGYEFSKLFTAQVGYVSQYDYNANVDPYTKNFLQTSLQFDFSGLKK